MTAVLASATMSARNGAVALWIAALGLLPPALAAAWGWRAALARSLPRADFVLTSGGELPTLDPALAQGPAASRVIRALYEGLYVRDPVAGVPVPALAETTEIAANGLSYAFGLRRGARWSNGDPLTAQDFEWSFRRILDPATESAFARELWCIRGARELHTGRGAGGEPVDRASVDLGVRAPEASRLVIELVHPSAHLLDLLASHQLVPVHRATLEAARALSPLGWRSHWGQPETLVCNGPFVLLERRLGDRLRLGKNELYWDAERVAMRTIDVLAVDDPTTAFNLYSAGEIDWLDDHVPASLVRRLVPRDDFDPAPRLALGFLRINTRRPPLDDARVRRALYGTINRILVCDQLLEAGQKPAYTLVPWGASGPYRSPPSRKEDLEGARQLLEDAGFGPKGARLGELRILHGASELQRSIAEIVAEGWAKYLDLQVTLVGDEGAVERQARLEYDAAVSYWSSGDPDLSRLFATFTSDSPDNRTGWSNAEFDRLVAEARVEVDLARRTQLLRSAETLLLDELPILPIYSDVSHPLLDPRAGGFAMNALGDEYPKLWFWMDDAELARSRRAAGRREKNVESHGPKDGLYSPRAQIERKAGRRTRR